MLRHSPSHTWFQPFFSFSFFLFVLVWFDFVFLYERHELKENYMITLFGFKLHLALMFEVWARHIWNGFWSGMWLASVGQGGNKGARWSQPPCWRVAPGRIAWYTMPKWQQTPSGVQEAAKLQGIPQWHQYEVVLTWWGWWRFDLD